jgi:hypothetical protein
MYYYIYFICIRDIHNKITYLFHISHNEEVESNQNYYQRIYPRRFCLNSLFPHFYSAGCFAVSAIIIS